MDRPVNTPREISEDRLSAKATDGHVRGRMGERPVDPRADEQDLPASYINGFRSMTTPEEVVLELGLNLPRPTGNRQHPYEPRFKADSRLIMSYYSAKRLAISLTEIVQRLERQFGPIELDSGRRRIDQTGQAQGERPIIRVPLSFERIEGDGESADPEGEHER